jgi:hypothetical protein
METDRVRSQISIDADRCESNEWDRDGVQIDACEAFDRIRVNTRNSAYDLVVISGRDGEVLIRGGRLFPEFHRASLIGATGGGHTVKLLGVYVGLCMELFADDRSVVTSPVLSVSRTPASPVASACRH